MSIPAVGSVAPAFTLNTTSGAAVTLASFRDKKHVLLAFFPMAYTGTCTKEVCAFSEDYGAFASKDVEVIPVSTDAVPSLAAFQAQTKSTVAFASDFKRDASRAYGVLNEEKFFANRAYILIDKSGVVRWTYVEENNGQRRENSELFTAIATLG